MCALSGKFLEGSVHSKMNKSPPVVTHQPNEWSLYSYVCIFSPHTILFHHCLLSLNCSVIIWLAYLLHAFQLKKKKKQKLSPPPQSWFSYNWTEMMGWKLIPVSLLFDRFQPYGVWELCSSEQCRGQQQRMWQEFYTGYGKPSK